MCEKDSFMEKDDDMNFIPWVQDPNVFSDMQTDSRIMEDPMVASMGMMSNSNMTQPMDMMDNPNMMQPMDMMCNPNMMKPMNTMCHPSMMKPMNIMCHPNMMQPMNMMCHPNMMQPMDMMSNPNMMCPMPMNMMGNPPMLKPMMNNTMTSPMTKVPCNISPKLEDKIPTQDSCGKESREIDDLNYSDDFRSKDKDVEKILRKIECNNPMIMKTLMCYNIPCNLARNIMKDIIKLTLMYK